MYVTIVFLVVLIFNNWKVDKKHWQKVWPCHNKYMFLVQTYQIWYNNTGTNYDSVFFSHNTCIYDHLLLNKSNISKYLRSTNIIWIIWRVIYQWILGNAKLIKNMVWFPIWTTIHQRSNDIKGNCAAFNNDQEHIRVSFKSL